MNYLYAVILGVLSIIGPCTFIMIPVILDKIRSSFTQVVYFFAGILLIFVLLGIVASITGIVFTNSVNRYLYFFAGAITLISALKLLGAIKVEYPHFKEPNKTSHAFFDGVLHGGVILGCIGPQLAALLTFIIAQRNMLNGVFMILFFGLGFILPFFIFGTIVTDQTVQLKVMQNINSIQKIGAILMMGAATYLLYFSFQGII